MSFENKERIEFKEFTDRFSKLNGNIDIDKFDEFYKEFDIKFDELVSKYPLFGKFIVEFCHNSFEMMAMSVDPFMMSIDSYWLEKKVFNTFKSGKCPKMDTIFIIHKLMFDKGVRDEILNIKLGEKDDIIINMLIQCFEVNDIKFVGKTVDEKKEYVFPLVCIMSRYPTIVRDLDLEYYTTDGNEKWLGNSFKYLREMILSND